MYLFNQSATAQPAPTVYFFLQERRKAAGTTGAAQPNMVCSSAVHVCWEKLFNYFDIKPRYVNLTEDCFVAKPEKVLLAVN